MKIETQFHWWAEVDSHWSDLLKILCRFLPMDKNEDIDKNILDFPLVVHVTELKDNRDKKLASYFKSAWWTAPDSSCIHRIPSWGVLCDLCSSEYWVFDEWQGDTIDTDKINDDDNVEWDN